MSFLFGINTSVQISFRGYLTEALQAGVDVLLAITDKRPAISTDSMDKPGHWECLPLKRLLHHVHQQWSEFQMKEPL